MTAWRLRPSASTRDTQRPVPVRDPAASMALIFDAMRHPIDPAYAEAASRRSELGDTGRRTRSPLLVISLVLLGLLVGIAAHALRVPASVANDRRAQLVKQVHAEQRANDRDGAEVTRLRGEVSAGQDSALSRSSERSLKDDLARAERDSGSTAVSGSGTEITLDNPPSATADAADSDPRTGENSRAITSTDLQRVVNGLWASGASAVSVNGQRITSLTAIRFAGSAILVNYRPLTTPYTIDAVGGEDFPDRATGGSGAQILQDLRSAGFTASTAKKSHLTIPAVVTLHVDHAHPAR